MFVTNWISNTKIQKISEITNFFRHYFLSRTEVKPLRLANKLFYWIPEMINHPLQKYVADPSMARSNKKQR